MGIGAGLYMCDVVVKSSRSLSHLLMSSCSVSYQRIRQPARGHQLIDAYLCTANARTPLETVWRRRIQVGLCTGTPGKIDPRHAETDSGAAEGVS